MQQAFLPVDMSNFNQKNIKIITNSALVKAGPGIFSDQKEIFDILIKTRAHMIKISSFALINEFF